MRERVEKAARDLGFSFSAIGRALQGGRSMTIGCLVPSLANPVFAEAVQCVQEVLLASDYQLLIASSNYDHGDPRAQRRPDTGSARGLPVSLMFQEPLDGFLTSHVDNF